MKKKKKTIAVEPHKQCSQNTDVYSQLCHPSQVAQVVKNLPANAGNIRDVGSVPGFGRSPGEGHGNPLQYSFLENPMDRRTWWAIVHRTTKSRT